MCVHEFRVLFAKEILSISSHICSVRCVDSLRVTTQGEMEYPCVYYHYVIADRSKNDRRVYTIIYYGAYVCVCLSIDMHCVHTLHLCAIMLCS